MNRFAIALAAGLLGSLPGATLLAQEGPPRDGDRPQRREGLNRPDGRPDGRPDRGPDGRPDRGPDRPDSFGGPGPGRPEGRPFMHGGDVRLPPHLQMLSHFLQVVDQYAKMAKDPATSGVAAVINAADLLKPRGTDAAIQYFTVLLPDVKNESVRRAIRLQLFNLYKESGQQDKALDQLKQLMTAQ